MKTIKYHFSDNLCFSRIQTRGLIVYNFIGIFSESYLKDLPPTLKFGMKEKRREIRKHRVGAYTIITICRKYMFCIRTTSFSNNYPTCLIMEDWKRRSSIILLLRCRIDLNLNVIFAVKLFDFVKLTKNKKSKTTSRKTQNNAHPWDIFHWVFSNWWRSL